MNKFIKQIIDYLLALICKGLDCKKINVIQSIQVQSTKIKLKGENTMIAQFQVDQHAIWEIGFLNDDGVPVKVALFEFASLNPDITVEEIQQDSPDNLYRLKISASIPTVGEIQANGKTGSGIDLPISLAVTTIPDEAESVSSVVRIEENV